MSTIYEKHDLLDKIAEILRDCAPDEMMCAHEIADEIKKRFPETFKAIGKPVGGAGSGQDSLARYIGWLLYPRGKRTIPGVKRRFIARVFGRTGVSTIAFKDGSSQQMHPAYGTALFALRREAE